MGASSVSGSAARARSGPPTSRVSGSATAIRANEPSAPVAARRDEQVVGDAVGERVDELRPRGHQRQHRRADDAAQHDQLLDELEREQVGRDAGGADGGVDEDDVDAGVERHEDQRGREREPPRATTERMRGRWGARAAGARRSGVRRSWSVIRHGEQQRGDEEADRRRAPRRDASWAAAIARPPSPSAATTASSAVWRCRRWSAWSQAPTFITTARGISCAPSTAPSEQASGPRSSARHRGHEQRGERSRARAARASSCAGAATVGVLDRRRTITGVMPGSSRKPAIAISDSAVTQSA